jgi:hypothetical protein
VSSKGSPGIVTTEAAMNLIASGATNPSTRAVAGVAIPDSKLAHEITELRSSPRVISAA